MVEEKSHHLAACIGSSWIGVATRRTAAGPGMAASVDVPLLEDRPSLRIVVDRAGVGEPSRRLATVHLRVQPRSDIRVGNYMIAVTGMNHGVSITMEHNRWD